MVNKSKAIKHIEELPSREQEIIWHQKMIEHARHQARVTKPSKYRRHLIAHSKYVVRLSHYLSKPCAFSVRHWVAMLREADFRAYQSKLAGVDICEHDAYFWWFGLGDESRYHLIREGSAAVQDEYEQEKKYRYKDKMEKLKESGLY